MNAPDIPHVELRSIRIENQVKPRFINSFGNTGTRWWAAVSLNLYDIDREAPVTEWFYLFVCSPEYIKNPLKKLSIDEKCTIIQASFDTNQVENEARRRLNEVNPKTWEDFYDQMQMHFDYEP